MKVRREMRMKPESDDQCCARTRCEIFARQSLIFVCFDPQLRTVSQERIGWAWSKTCHDSAETIAK